MICGAKGSVEKMKASMRLRREKKSWESLSWRHFLWSKKA